MDNNRFEPYGPGNNRRRRYRTWLYAANPQIPASTAARHRRRAAEIGVIQHQDAGAPLQQNEIAHRDEEPLGDAEVLQNIPLEIENQIPEGNNIDSVSVDNSDESDAENEEDEADAGDGNNEGQEQNPNERWQPARLPELDVPFFPPLPCTKFECLLMVVSFQFRHGLTQTAALDLCRLINNIFGGDYIPDTDWFFDKVFGKPDYVYHFYCSKCLNYITHRRRDAPFEGSQLCELCETNCNFKGMNSGHFFITFPMKDQLKLLLENTKNVMNHLNYRFEREVENGVIGDIYDGKVYSNLMQDGNFLSDFNNLSITFNTDGASVFDGTHNTLWPIHYCINEFPPSVRFDQVNTLLAGIWFGSHEPKMPLFLSGFVSELEALYDTGFSWHSPQGQRIDSKVIVLNCVADSKARPLVQGMKMHNGYYGCGLCNHHGVMYDGSNQAKYPINDDLYLLDDFSFSYTVTGVHPVTKIMGRSAVEDRSNESIRREMDLAEVNRTAAGKGDVNGVKERSILWALSHFDLSFGFPVDYLHAVLLGVVRATTNFWLESSKETPTYNISVRFHEIESRLLNIKPPVALSRRPRSLEQRGGWHANEWRSWLLYYSLPCLRGILPSRFLQHHCLLVSALFIMLRDNITEESLRKACIYLGQYVVDYRSLYGGSLTYFNCHLLLHLGKCVNLFGPLYCFSAFSFESANGSLVKLVKGSRGVLSQIANKYTRAKLLPYITDLYTISENTKKYCSDLLYYRSSRQVCRDGHITVLGKRVCRPLSEEQGRAIAESGHIVTTETYERMIVNGVMIHARCYSRRGQKSDSSVAILTNKRICALERIIDPQYFQGDGPPKFLALIRKVNVNMSESIVVHPHGAKAAHIKPCGPIVYGDYQVVTLDVFTDVLILMDCLDCSYVAMLPNHYEKD